MHDVHSYISGPFSILVFGQSYWKYCFVLCPVSSGPFSVCASCTVEFTGSIDTFFTTLKDVPSSSSSFIVHTDRLDDKDETDESIR